LREIEIFLRVQSKEEEEKRKTENDDVSKIKLLGFTDFFVSYMLYYIISDSIEKLNTTTTKQKMR
jgi:hypothetical protein